MMFHIFAESEGAVAAILLLQARSALPHPRADQGTLDYRDYSLVSIYCFIIGRSRYDEVSRLDCCQDWLTNI